MARYLAIYNGRTCHRGLAGRTPIQQLDLLRATQGTGEKTHLEALISRWGAEPQVFSDAADVISGLPNSKWFLAAGGDDRIAAGAGHETVVAAQSDD